MRTVTATGASTGQELGTAGFVRLTASYALASIQFWMTVPLAALVLAERGVPAWQIGFVGAVPWLMLGLLLPWTASLAGRFGAFGVYRCGLGLAVLGAALFLVDGGIAVWLTAYACCGAGIALRWTVADGTILALTPASIRGRRIGLFETLIGGTTALGPLIPAWFGTHDTNAFWIGLALTLAAFLPLRARDMPDVALGTTPQPLRTLLRTLRAVPLGIVAATTAGVLEGAGTKLLPVHALGLGLDTALAATAVAVFGAGNLATQYAAGRIADRTGARGPTRIVLVAVVVLALLLPWAASAGLVAYAAVLFLLGGAVGSLYTFGAVEVSRLGAPLAVMNGIAGIGLGYTLGSVAGPVLAGAATSLDPTWGLPLTIAVGSGIAVFVALRVGQAAASQTGEKS